MQSISIGNALLFSYLFVVGRFLTLLILGGGPVMMMLQYIFISIVISKTNDKRGIRGRTIER